MVLAILLHICYQFSYLVAEARETYFLLKYEILFQYITKSLRTIVRRIQISLVGPMNVPGFIVI